MQRMTLSALLMSGMLAVASPQASIADDAEQLLTIDHRIPRVSTMPAIAGQTVELYVRERVQAATVLRSPSSVGKVVLCVSCAWNGAVPGRTLAVLPHKTGGPA